MNGIFYILFKVATAVNLLIGIIALVCLNIPVAVVMFIAAGLTKKCSSAFTDEESNT